MDEYKREALVLIQFAVADMLEQGKISLSDAGKQLVQVAHDYILAGELANAREALLQCDDFYFTDFIQEQRKEDKHFDGIVTEVDEVFLLDHFRRDGAGNA